MRSKKKEEKSPSSHGLLRPGKERYSLSHWEIAMTEEESREFEKFLSYNISGPTRPLRRLEERNKHMSLTSVSKILSTEEVVEIIKSALAEKINQPFDFSFIRSEEFDGDHSAHDQWDNPLDELAIFTGDGMVRVIYFSEPEYDPSSIDLFQGNEDSATGNY